MKIDLRKTAGSEIFVKAPASSREIGVVARSAVHLDPSWGRPLRLGLAARRPQIRGQAP